MLLRRACFSITVSVSLLLAAIGYSAAAQDCFDCGDLLFLRTPREPSISPDGKWIAYRLVEPPDTSRGVRKFGGDIWIADFEGKLGPRRFAFGRGGETSPGWSPDGEWVTFLSDRKEEGVMQLYGMRFGGGEAERWTDFGGGVASYAWSPGGGRVAVIAREPVPPEAELERKRGLDERVVGEGEGFGRLWLVDFETGKTLAMTPDSLHVQSLEWSPEGTAVAMVVSDDPGAEEFHFHARLEVLSMESGERSVLCEGVSGRPAWSPDGRSIAVEYILRHPEITIGAPVVGVVDVGSGSLRLLGKRHAGALFSPKWLAGGEKLVVLELAGVRAKLAYLSVRDDKVESFEDLLIPYKYWNAFDVSRDGSRLAALKGSPGSPPELWSIERGWLGKKRKLTDLNPWLKERSLPRVKVVRWKSRDGTEIEGVLYLPPDYTEGKLYASVITVHGGPMWAWWLGWHGSWHEWAVPLACRGFVVLLPNPRGSLGYGVGFARASFEDWGGGDFEDILAGADFLIEEGYADPDRMGIGGWSYGGYMSAWAVTRTRRFAAAVVGAGISNLFSFHGTTDVTPTFLSSYFRDVAYKCRDAYGAHSPITYVGQAETPTLILHGEADVRVPLGQGYELYRGMRQLGLPVEFVVYPRERHSFEEIYHQINVVERVIDWFESHLE